jgi:hypothetical protein
VVLRAVVSCNPGGILRLPNWAVLVRQEELPLPVHRQRVRLGPQPRPMSAAIFIGALS